MANISSNKQGKKSMAEYKDTGDTPNTEKTFSPVYSYSQKISNLIAEGKITAPKYRTLSQEQMTTYYTAKDLPDYDMQKIKAGISRANEQTFAENWDAAVTINAMDLLSGNKERAQMAIGNMLATEDYSPLIPLGAEVAGYSVGAKVGAKKAAQMGAGKIATKAAGIATGVAAGAAAGAATSGILGIFHTSPAGDEFDTIVDEAKRRELESRKTLEEKGFSPEKIEEIMALKKKVQNVGLSMLRAANDSARQRAEVMPYIDPDSAALQIVGGIRSFGEMATVGWLAGAARAGIAKKALENKLGKTATRFSKNEAVERLARIKGVETGRAASIGLMDVDIMGAGAIESVQKYIEDTGDTELVNYKGDITNIAVDALNTRIQNIIEKKFGVPALFTKAVGKRITSKYGEWLNGFAQEFSQGVINDFAEWTKGNQTAQDIVKNIPSNLVDGLIGAILQGGIGTGIYTYYHNESVNQLTDVIMAQSTKENPIDEQKARSFAESKINDLENEITNDITNEVVGFVDAKDYKGKIYETVRENLQKTVDFQRERMKDTLEGSKYDEMTEDELAQHIESVAQDMTDRVVIHALDEKIPLSEVPQLKGETIDGQYYIEGASYAKDTMEQLAKEREAIRAVVYAERKAKADELLAEKMAEGAEIARTKREQAETAQQTKEAKERARAAEKSAKAMEKSVKASLKAQQEEMKAKVRAVNKEKTDTVDEIIHGNVDIIRDILSKNGLQTRELSGTGVKDLAKMNWQLFKGMNLGQSQSRGTPQVKLTDIARNVKSGDDVLKRAGFEQKEIDEMDDATWNKLVKEQYKIEREELGLDKEPEMTEEEIEQFLKDTEGLDWQTAYTSGTTYYEKPSTEYILRNGEGQIVHGWGLYFLEDQKKNKERYREGQFAGKLVYVANMPKTTTQRIKGTKTEKESQIVKMVLDSIAGRTPINMYKPIKFAGGVSSYIPLFYVDAMYELLGSKANKADKAFLDKIILEKGQLADETVFKVEPEMSDWMKAAIQRTLDEHNDPHSTFYQKDLPYVFANILVFKDIDKKLTDFVKKEFKHKDLNATENKALADAIVTYVQDGGRIEYEPFDNAIFKEAGAQVIDFKSSNAQVIAERLRDTLEGGYRQMTVDEVITNNPSMYGGYIGMLALFSRSPFSAVSDLMYSINSGKTTLSNIDENKDFQYMKNQVEKYKGKPGEHLVNTSYTSLVSLIDSAKKIYDSETFNKDWSYQGEDTKTWIALTEAMRNMTQDQIDTIGLYLMTNLDLKQHEAELMIDMLQHPENIKKTRGQQLEADIPENDVLLDEDLKLKDQDSKDIIRNIITDWSWDFSKDLIDNVSEKDWQLYASKHGIKDKTLTDFVDRLFEDHMKHFDPTVTKERELLVDYIMANMTGEGLYLTLTDIIPQTYIELESGEEIGEVKDYDEGLKKSIMGETIPVELARDVSLYLNEQGIKGIKYRGGIDGTGFVVFSDEAVTVLNRIDDEERMYYQSQQRGKGGAYDARTRSITLGAGANITTLPHELAHYWIDKNFRWARSGHASEAWLKQWMAVEKWLGISPDDKRLDRNASEKFARAYERFLAEEQLPLVLKKSMADFRDFVLDHYDYELDDAKGLQDKLGRPIKLNDDVKAWFRKSIYEDYMSPTEQAIVNERLAVADEEYAEVQPQVEEEQAIQEKANTSAEITAPTGTEIQKEANVSNDTILGKKRTIGGGEEKESKGAIGQALDKTYESTNWDVQEEMVNNYLATVSTDEALDALDNDTYPDKIDPNFLRQALAEKLLEEGRELEAAALIEETADDFTESAQKLQAARRINTPFTNAIRMLTVGKAMKLAEAKYGKNKDAVKSLDAAINALVAKYEQDYANAQTDEERELVFATMQDEAIRTIGTLDKTVTDRIDFQDIEDKEERKQAKALRKRQIQRGSVKAYRSRAKRALKQALGLEPTREQVKEIKKLSVDVAKTIRDYRKAVKENKTSAIDPTSILEAQNKLNEYMNKQLPPRVLSNVSDALNSYMMANMLWNPATNVFNVWSTWVQMIPHMAATYIDYGKGTIPFNQKLKLIKQALALQAKTGYNIFSLRDFFDKKTLWAEKYYEPQTKVGKVQAFPLTMLGLADTANKGLIFLTHADSMATKQAKEEGKKNGWAQAQIDQRAKELFYQSLNTDPRTITLDGLKIREESVKEGEEATFTQMTRTAELVNKIRRFLNLGQKTGVGSLIMPFTTTIANIAEDTVKNYALGSVRGLVNAPKALATQFDKTATAEMKKEAWKALKPETKNVIKNMIGVLMLLGIALDSDDEDYVLGYDRQTELDKDIRQNRNAPSGYAIRIGNKWIDLDLFGIGSPYAKAYLIAKRYGFSPDGWVKGTASMIDLVPGIAEIQSMYDKYSQSQTWSGDWEALSELGSDKASDVLERLIPAQALFNQLGNIEDTSKRVSWNRWYDRAISKIPFLRRTLPERTSKQTGKVIPQTDDWWNLATGQRIKEYIKPAQADKARYEFALSGKALAYREGNSKLKELGKDSEKYNEAVQKVRKLFTQKLESASQTSAYKNADIDEKRKIANKLHTDAMEEVKKEYGLAKPKKSAPKKKRKND